MQTKETVENVNEIIQSSDGFGLGFSLPETIEKNLLKAAGRLVTGATNIGIAWCESKAQHIRTKQNAKDIVTIESARAAARKFGQDDSLADRAVEYHAQDIVRQQANREEIFRKAGEELAANPPAEDTNRTIDDDWMSVFSREASQKSSEELQTYFARILAGEIKAPGTFSIKLINTLSQLTPNAANTFQNLCNISCSFFEGLTSIAITNFSASAALNGLKDYEASYSKLMELTSFDLIIPNLESTLKTDWLNDNKAIFDFAGDSVWLEPINKNNKPSLPQLQGVLFSPFGIELRKVILVQPNKEYAAKLLGFFEENRFNLIKVIGNSGGQLQGKPYSL